MIRRYIERLAREAVAQELGKLLKSEGESLDWWRDKVRRTVQEHNELQQKLWGHDMPWDIHVPVAARVETEPQQYALHYPKDILLALVNALLVDENGKLRLRKPAPESKDE